MSAIPPSAAAPATANPAAGIEAPFRTDHLQADLKGRSVRGGAVTMASQGCKFLLGMGSTMVLARLLTPEDYGLVGMVAAVTGFAVVFKDLGLSTATIQRADITHEQVSTLFWLNVGMGFLISLVILAAAPMIAWFYHDPRLLPISMALASLYVIGGLTTQHQALLQRQMRFTALALVEVLSLLIGITVGVVLAWLGWGPWALVALSAAQAVATAAGVWMACSWRPGGFGTIAPVRSLLSFGGNITVVDCFSYVTRNLDNVLLGRYWGSQVLAFYSKAYQLLLMPIQQINTPIRSVAVPALSRLQDQPGEFRKFYLKALTFINLVSLPLISLFIIFAEEIVRVVLGPQWKEVGIIFRWLGVAALPQPLMNTAGWLYVASGQTARMMRWAWFSTPTLVLSFLVGLPWGAEGVAISVMVAVWFLTWPMMNFATRGTAVSTRDVFRAAMGPALATVVAMVPCVAMKYWLASRLPEFALIMVCSIVAMLFYAWFTTRILKMTGDFVSLLNHFRRPGHA